MAGQTWKDLKRKSGPASASVESLKPKPAQLNQEELQRRAVENSPKLGRLMDQRKQLEGKLNNLVSGGTNLEPRDAARFHVPTFAQRQQQQRAWEAQHEAQLQRSREIRLQNRAPEEQVADRTPRGPSEVSQWISSRDGGQPQNDEVGQWLSQRDRDRQRIRDSARDRLAPLSQASDTVRQIRQPMSNMSSQLEDLDRKLAAEGLDTEREELKKLGADKLSTANKQIDKYTKMLDAPKKAVEKIDKGWEHRQDQISGAMDRVGPYAERSRRRLSTETGGSGDLFERMERNREQALTRRQERREQEEKDNERRERALRRKRESVI